MAIDLFISILLKQSDLKMIEEKLKISKFYFNRQFHWISHEDMHVTLAFIKNVAEKDVSKFAHLVSKVEKSVGLQTNIVDIIRFRSALAVALTPASLFIKLKTRVEALYMESGLNTYALEKTVQFTPHITLARMPGQAVIGSSLEQQVVQELKKVLIPRTVTLDGMALMTRIPHKVVAPVYKILAYGQ